MIEQSSIVYDDILNTFPWGMDALGNSVVTLVEDGVETGASDELKDEILGLGDNANLKAYLDASNWIDSIAVYLKEIGQIPLLTAEQEVTLAKRMEAGLVAQAELDSNSHACKEQARLRQTVMAGLAARNHLIAANLRLVVSVAKRYNGCGVPFLDLIQEGNIGLMRAVDRFDYQLGNKLSTYATWWIRQAITRTLASQSRTIRLPTHVGHKVGELLRTIQRLIQDWGREPTLEELADAMGVSLHKAKEILRVSLLPLSLDIPVGDREESTLGDLLGKDGPSVENVVISLTLRTLVWEVLQGLSPRELRILQLRFGLIDGELHTLSKVGKKLGISYQRAGQLESRALHRLRHPRHIRRLKEFL